MSNNPAGDAAARNTKERVLIFIVVFLGLLIVAALGAVVVKIIYLSSSSSVQPAKPDSAVKARLSVPAGAVVKSISVSGDRLAIHYETPGGVGISVLDLATGAVLREVDVVPAP